MVSGEKRNCEEENGLESITAILLDIEGTTTSISFVKDVLFPYVKENLEAYVNNHWSDDEFKADLKALRCQAEKDAEEKIENFCPIEDGENEKETLIKNVLWQMDLDRKTTALKQLQGHIWREGYESGKLKGHVYEEVPQVLKKWSEDGRKLYIYSSGSVEAQKLLFKNSEAGDLSEYFSGYFDTETGSKTEASSYIQIAKAIECDPGQILFLTDVVKEAVAADKGGLQVMIVIRDGNAPLADDVEKGFETLSNLQDLVFESANKKKKICEEDSQDRKSSETSEKNVEEKGEPLEMKNKDAEKMDTEITVCQRSKEDLKTETKTEENGENQAEVNSKVPDPEVPQTESEATEMDVDDSSATGRDAEEPESEGKKVEETTEEMPQRKPNKDESGGEAVAENSDETEENESSKIEKEEKAEHEEKSLNGHENGENKENEGKKSDAVILAAPAALMEEAKNGDANGKAEEKAEAVEEAETAEAVAVKKVAAADDPSDSAVEVTA